MDKELSKEEIIAARLKREGFHGMKDAIQRATPKTWNDYILYGCMNEYADQQAKKKAIAFAKFLVDNTEIIHTEKITLYRYENANYVIDDIYEEFIRQDV